MELISVHVPKTAGTTFGKLLVQIYGEELVRKDYTDLDTREFPSEVRVVHGHFSVGKYHNLFPEAHRVAWIRHPVAWILSVYHYAKHIARGGDTLHRRLHDENLSFLEYASHPLACNPYTRNYLYGCDIDDFYFVGVHEHFREDLGDLSRKLGWPSTGFGVDNANPEPGYREKADRILADRAMVKQVEALYEPDLQLYRRALRLRQQRLRDGRRLHFWWPQSRAVAG